MASSKRPNRHDLDSIAWRAMKERGLEPEFSPAAIAQLQRIDGAAQAAPAGTPIRDLRELLWCSIDNDDSRDLDQLTVAEPLPRGGARVLVAIADVDSLVERDTPIDAHARHNTTSVYTAARVFPMLPERLSTDLTSLNEGEPRLAMVVSMEISDEGEIGASEVFRARVQNKAKLAYNSVDAWIEKRAPAPPRLAAVPGLEDNLRLQDRLAQALRCRRHEQGALELQTLEPRPVFEGDEITDLVPDEHNRAKELIEDFMVAANGATARFLEQKGFPSLRRVLRSPERWARIVALAQDLGESLPGEPSSAALEEFLVRRRAADPERFPDLSLSVVKLLGRGEYVLELPGQDLQGHFGLAVRDYTHSTAPNRRFPDLIAQRLLKAALAGARPPYKNKELADLGTHCTLQEDAANKVERQVAKSYY
jgi:exoribonuclease-2